MDHPFIMTLVETFEAGPGVAWTDQFVRGFVAGPLGESLPGPSKPLRVWAKWVAATLKTIKTGSASEGSSGFASLAPPPVQSAKSVYILTELITGGELFRLSAARCGVIPSARCWSPLKEGGQELSLDGMRWTLRHGAIRQIPTAWALFEHFSRECQDTHRDHKTQKPDKTLL